MLAPRPGGPAQRFARVLSDRHPALVFLAALLLSWLIVAGLSIAIGEFVNHVLLPAWGIRGADESVNDWLLRQRSSGLTDASSVGSFAGGAPLLPIIAALLAVAFAVRRWWRLVAFAVFALAVESSLYRVTTLVIHRDRPSVPRLESLPVHASYPSGHTAASVAVYAGIALLLTSRLTGGRSRALAWSAAVLMTLFVAASRLYRGMHHPIDVAAGMLLGVAALVIVVFACRAAGAAATARAGSDR